MPANSRECSILGRTHGATIFLIHSGVVESVTPIGIATLQLLNVNDADRIELRRIKR